MPPSVSPMDKPSYAFIGTYLPRQCGIGTFTHDLCEAVALQAGQQSDAFAVAINDIPEGYAYPPRVRFEIRQNAQADYRLAADFLNIRQVTALCLQHEYGIYGGPSGGHILGLLRRVRRPMVATLHTVLGEPTTQQKVVLEEIGRLMDRVVVMTDVARGILQEVYDIPEEKIVTIPHGIPDVPFVDPNYFKDQFGVEGKKVMLTFGLLSPGKGLENAIDALPMILEKHPEVTYMILGATHPNVKRESGEEYRSSLIRRAHKLGVGENVIFVNRFVALDELVEYLGSADLYITPYLNEAQITSGTLAYALGAGKATVSTPYWYAQEMLDDGRGVLVPFRDPKAIASRVLELLDNETQRHAMRKRAYTFCRKMTWQRVAQDYLDLFAEACESWVERQHQPAAPAVELPETAPERIGELPDVDLRHLRILTDDTGILQFCRYATPDRREGYRTDDNARALTAATMYWDQTHDTEVLGLIQTYLSYLAFAMDPDSGLFREYMDYTRGFGDQAGSEDCQGRAIWALGTAVALCPYESMIALATELLAKALPATETFVSPRAWAYGIVGIHAYLRRFGGDSDARRYRQQMTDRLYHLFLDNATEEWTWCEDVVTYANAKLPHALLMSGKWMRRDELIDMGKRALRWLVDLQTTEEGHLSIIGTRGWHVRGGVRAEFDQQPLEAHALVDACIEAYHVTREPQWLADAQRAFHWFLGENDLRTSLYDFTTGGCRDGLMADHASENQGAESTLAWLMSLLLVQEMQMEQTLGQAAADSNHGVRPVPRPLGRTESVTESPARTNGIAHRDD